jgi:protein TonB
MRTIALLESERHPAKSGGGSAASVLLHVALVGLAIIATSQARDGLGRERTVYIPLPRFQPQLPSVPHTVTQQRAPAIPAPHAPALSIQFPTVTPTTIASPTISPDVPTTIGSGAAPLPATSPGVGTPVSAPAGNATFTGDEVDVAASVLPGQHGPIYPEGLRIIGVEGRVFARFIIEKNGRVESEPTILSATADEFAAAVKRYLSSARYRPASKNGEAVRQLAEQEFVFTVRR